MSVRPLTEHHREFLSLKEGCTESCESTIVKLPHCWKSRHGSFVIVLFCLLSSKPAAAVPGNCLQGQRISLFIKGYFHLCPRMDFLQTLHIINSLYTSYENIFIESDS